MVETETKALTLKQVRQRLNNQWIAEKQQKSETEHDSNKLQETGDVYRHPLWATEQLENTQSRLC